jgi:hypothetical protein
MNRFNTAAIGLALVLTCPVACTSGGDPKEDAGSADADTDVDSDTDTDTDTDADTDTGEECTPVDEAPWLAPDDIDFTEVDEPQVGSWIYYGVWGPPDSLEMINPDGTSSATRFTVNRLWSFGVAHDGVTIAFSSVDPSQEEHWCVTIGDAIQYTWLFAPGEPPEQITSGPHNDECHLFSSGDDQLYLCRRDNFWQELTDDGLEFGNDPYRVLVHEISSADETWLTPLDEAISDIGPALRADGTILFWRQVSPSFDQSLMSMDADGTDIQELVADGTNPVTSPDGLQVLYRDGWRRLMLGDSADPAAAAQIIDGGDDFIVDFDFSPDLTQVAYTRGREDASCSDLWVAEIDGQNQTLVVDCVEAAQFITGVRWVQID